MRLAPLIGRHSLPVLLATVVLAGGSLSACGSTTAAGMTSADSSDATEATGSAGTAGTVTATVTGGMDLLPSDKGRPTLLYDAMLGVPAGTYAQAFAGVEPDPGHDPSEEHAQANKEVLMSVLAPYGVTNEQLDEVANHYRFDGTKGETWPHREAVVEAIVAADGTVTGFTVVDPGYGYPYPPTITVPGRPDLQATAELAYTDDYDTNGSIASVTLA